MNKFKSQGDFKSFIDDLNTNYDNYENISNMKIIDLIVNKFMDHNNYTNTIYKKINEHMIYRKNIDIIILDQQLFMKRINIDMDEYNNTIDEFEEYKSTLQIYKEKYNAIIDFYTITTTNIHISVFNGIYTTDSYKVYNKKTNTLKETLEVV
jgi:hypothetical protein